MSCSACGSNSDVDALVSCYRRCDSTNPEHLGPTPMRFPFKATCALTTVMVACLCTTPASAQGTTDATPASESTSKTAVCDGYRLVTVFFRCIPHDVSGIVQGDALRSLAVGGLLAGGSILLDDEVRKKMSE